MRKKLTKIESLTSTLKADGCISQLPLPSQIHSLLPSGTLSLINHRLLTSHQSRQREPDGRKRGWPSVTSGRLPSAGHSALLAEGMSLSYLHRGLAIPEPSKAGCNIEPCCHGYLAISPELWHQYLQGARALPHAYVYTRQGPGHIWASYNVSSKKWWRRRERWQGESRHVMGAHVAKWTNEGACWLPWRKAGRVKAELGIFSFKLTIRWLVWGSHAHTFRVLSFPGQFLPHSPTTHDKTMVGETMGV